MRRVVQLCREIDETARDIYAELVTRCGQGGLDEFWAEMSAEEAQHVRFWRAAEQGEQLERLPTVFDSPGQVAAELEANLSKARAMLGRSGEALTIAAAFVVAYRMEFYLLHPAFEMLFRVLGSLGGVANPEQDYECHIKAFVDALARHGAATPELDLLGETLQHLWKENRALATQSTQDFLTGCLNRRGWLVLSSQLAHLARRKRWSVALLMVDIDHFKRVNDTYGHDVGDVVLRRVAATLGGRLRSSDVLGRYGGEEFAVFLPQTSAEAAATVAEDLRRAVEASEGEGPAVTVSVGCAAGTLGEQPVADCNCLLREADQALYVAKAEGRNCVRLAPEACLSTE